MASDAILLLASKFETRLRRLEDAKPELFHVALIRFWGFLTNTSIFCGILEELAARSERLMEAAESVFKEQRIIAKTEAEQLALAYLVLLKCVNSSGSMPEVRIGSKYRDNSGDDALRAFKREFLYPITDYVVEQLDDKRFFLSMLRRFKHKCEWFQRERLLEAFQANMQVGEKTLALSLYEYLHDQGLSFSIEPSSVSGRADLIAAQNSSDPLIADGS